MDTIQSDWWGREWHPSRDWKNEERVLEAERMPDGKTQNREGTQLFKDLRKVL